MTAIWTKETSKSTALLKYKRKRLSLFVITIGILISCTVQAQDFSQPKGVHYSTERVETDKKHNSSIPNAHNSTGRAKQTILNSNNIVDINDELNEEELSGKSPQPARGFLFGASGGGNVKSVTKVPPSSSQSTPTTTTTTTTNGPERQVRQTTKRRTSSHDQTSTTSITPTTEDLLEESNYNDRDKRLRLNSANNNKIRRNNINKKKKKNDEEEIEPDLGDNEEDIEGLDDINTYEDDIKLRKRKRAKQTNSSSSSSTTTTTSDPNTSTTSLNDNLTITKVTTPSTSDNSSLIPDSIIKNNSNETLINKHSHVNISPYLASNKQTIENVNISHAINNTKSNAESSMKGINEDYTKLHNNVYEQVGSLRKFIIVSSICVVVATTIAVAIIVFFSK